MIKRHRKCDQRRGVVLIEAALVFPILLLLTFGLIEYGWLFLRMESLSNAARRGARMAVTPDATNSDVVSAIGNMMTYSGLEDSGYTVTVSSLDVDPGETVTVRIVVPNYQNIMLIQSPMIPVPDQIERGVTMAKEGP